MMVDRGAEAIVFASCIAKGNPIGFPCPHFVKMKEAVERGGLRIRSRQLRGGSSPFLGTKSKSSRMFESFFFGPQST